MSLGLPYQSARVAVSRALNHAAHVAAGISLAAALVIGVALRTAVTDVVLWPALCALILMMAALAFTEIRPSMLTCGVYLIVGAGCMYLYAMAALSQRQIVINSDSFGLALPKIALILVGGATVGVPGALIWASAGYVLGETVTILAAVQTGGLYHFDTTALSVYLIVCVLLSSLGLARRHNRLAQPSVNRAEHDERLASMRWRLELKAVALMHDTALNHLAAIAGSESDVLGSRLAAQMTRDVELLTGDRWLAEGLPTVDGSENTDWRRGALAEVILQARREGLQVDVTGDLSVIGRLSGRVASALALAVQQCLANVVKHAGTNKAEIAVYGSVDSVTVMVIDNGRGFEPKGVSADRLGIRNSVRGRIEAVDGSVQIWSTVGRGTSVMIQLPVVADTVSPEMDRMSDGVPG